MFRAESLPRLFEARDGLVTETADDGEHGVEVLGVFAMSCHLDKVLHQLHSLQDGSFSNDLAHHPEHLAVDQMREARQVGVTRLRGEVEELVNVLGCLDALEELKVAQSELGSHLRRVQLQLVNLTLLKTNTTNQNKGHFRDDVTNRVLRTLMRSGTMSSGTRASVAT